MKSSLLRVALAFLPLLATEAQSYDGRRETRLGFRSYTYSKSRETTKTNVEQKTGAGTAVVTERKDSENERSWSFFSALPAIELEVFHNQLIAGSTIFGVLGAVGGDAWLGYEVSKTMEAGLYTRINYRYTKREQSSAPDSGVGGSETKTHTSDKSLGVGPYMTMTFGTKTLFELTAALLILKESEESGTTTKETRSGFGLNIDFDAVVPLTRSLSYVGGLGFAYSKYDSGKKVTRSGASETEESIDRAERQSWVLFPLGIRLTIGGGRAKAKESEEKSAATR